jgi:hypothetical protein
MSQSGHLTGTGGAVSSSVLTAAEGSSACLQRTGLLPTCGVVKAEETARSDRQVNRSFIVLISGIEGADRFLFLERMCC